MFATIDIPCSPMRSARSCFANSDCVSKFAMASGLMFEDSQLETDQFEIRAAIFFEEPRLGGFESGTKGNQPFGGGP